VEIHGLDVHALFPSPLHDSPNLKWLLAGDQFSDERLEVSKWLREFEHQRLTQESPAGIRESGSEPSYTGWRRKAGPSSQTPRDDRRGGRTRGSAPTKARMAALHKSSGVFKGAARLTEDLMRRLGMVLALIFASVNIAVAPTALT